MRKKERKENEWRKKGERKERNVHIMHVIIIKDNLELKHDIIITRSLNCLRTLF